MQWCRAAARSSRPSASCGGGQAEELGQAGGLGREGGQGEQGSGQSWSPAQLAGPNSQLGVEELYPGSLRHYGKRLMWAESSWDSQPQPALLPAFRACSGLQEYLRLTVALPMLWGVSSWRQGGAMGRNLHLVGGACAAWHAEHVVMGRAGRLQLPRACVSAYIPRHCPPARLPSPQHLPEEAPSPQVPPEVDRLKRGIKSGGGIIERVHQEWHIY